MTETNVENVTRESGFLPQLVERVGVAFVIASRQIERDVLFHEITDDETRHLMCAVLEASGIAELLEALIQIADEGDAEISSAQQLEGCRDIARIILAKHGSSISEVHGNPRRLCPSEVPRDSEGRAGERPEPVGVETAERDYAEAMAARVARERMIAAAPVLYEALEALMANDGARGTYHAGKAYDAKQAAEHALAKARGDA